MGQKDPLEKEMATHSSILAWEIQWTEEDSPQDRKESDTTELLSRQQHAARPMKRGNLDTDELLDHHVTMTVEIRMRLLQVRDQRSPANHKKLGERPGTELSS